MKFKLRIAALLIVTPCLLVAQGDDNGHTHDNMYAPKQTSRFDNTNGRGLIVGAFGLGVRLHATNLNNVGINTFFRYDGSHSDRPTQNTPPKKRGGVLTLGYNVNRKAQFALMNDGKINPSPRAYIREEGSDGGWGPWEELYHTGNSNKTSVNWAANNIEAEGQINAGCLSINSVNPISSVNGFRNRIQFEGLPSGAIVFNPGTTEELMFGFHSNGNFYWGTGRQAGNRYVMSLSNNGRLRVYNSVTIGDDPQDNALNVTGTIKGDRIQTSSESAEAHIGLGRNDANYFIANGGSSSYMAFITGDRTRGIGNKNPNLVLKADKNSYFNGAVAIGTNDPGDSELAVNGTIRAKEVKIEATNWPDYVFLPDYHLLPLTEVEAHIGSHGHLPDVPSAGAVEEQGVSLGEMNAILLRKIEELTLYSIEQEKRLEKQSEEIEELKSQNQRIEQLEQLIRGVIKQ